MGTYCPTSEDASGTYVLAVVTPLDPAKPLLLKAVVNVDAAASPMTIQMVLTPLSVIDKTPIGESIETEAEPIEDDGSFVLPFGAVAVTGEANPISGSDIEANLILEGQIRGADSICGVVTGQLIKPTEFDLEGTTVGMAAVAEDNFADVEPSLQCSACSE
jgi:hypothetical protein